ncbi:MAG: sigma-70 family RNA polymerase sigma factor [Candidatus Rokubacteria bacterium]|nr:sigma-70 family RNA polymerase sigma factor [Candidatus Rokubacteria bacterium]
MEIAALDSHCGRPTARSRAGDEELVEGLRRGDPAAIEALVDRYGGWIHRVVRRMLDDSRDAEEVTQDVLLSVIQKIETFRGDAAFSSWLYRIAANAAYGRLRALRSRREVSLEPFLPVFDDEGRHATPVVDWSSRLDDPAVAEEVRGAIESSLGRLSEQYRAVFLLRDVEGLTNEDVAAALGLTVAAVKSRLHRARLVVRQQLTRRLASGR